MSKILRIIAFLSIIISFIGFYNIALADIPNIDIVQNPRPVSVSDKTLTITVKSQDGSEIFPAANYSFAAWKGSLEKGNVCTKTNLSGALATPISISKTEISARWGITNCEAVGDYWHFRLWVGSSWDEMDSQDNIIVNDYPFSFTQQGGTFVTITAKNPTVYAGQSAWIIITNGVIGNAYTFWWDGATLVDKKNITIGQNDPNPREVEFPNPPTNQSPRKLCWEYGNLPTVPLPIPPGSGCNKFVSFTFKSNQPAPPPPTVPVCTIIPAPAPTIPEKSNVDIKIEVANGTTVSAWAVDSTGKMFDVSSGTADITNVVSLNLLKGASAGSYSAKVFNGSQRICDPDPTFTVGGIAGGPPPTHPPCADPANCTKGGGQIIPGCGDKDDPRGYGIPTAIGCIHTNPAEFAKDLMTWVIGIGGGVAFLMMLLGAFQMLTSAGNPDTLRAGRERLTSAVIGLLIVIFAVLLLQIIGWDILRIEGFGR